MNFPRIYYFRKSAKQLLENVNLIICGIRRHISSSAKTIPISFIVTTQAKQNNIVYPLLENNIGFFPEYDIFQRQKLYIYILCFPIKTLLKGLKHYENINMQALLLTYPHSIICTDKNKSVNSQ